MVICMSLIYGEKETFFAEKVVFPKEKMTKSDEISTIALLFVISTVIIVLLDSHFCSDVLIFIKSGSKGLNWEDLKLSGSAVEKFSLTKVSI